MRAVLTPPGRTEWRDLVLLGIGAAALLHGLSSGAFAACGVGAVVTLTSLTAIRKNNGTRWIYGTCGGTLLVLGLLATVGRHQVTPDAGWSILSGVALLVGATLPRRETDAAMEEWMGACGPLVLLERSSRYVDAGILECIVANALPSPGTGPGSWRVRGEKPEFEVNGPKITFRIHVSDEAYWTSCDEIALAVPDLRAQRTVLAHTGYLRVDCTGLAQDLSPERAGCWQRCLVASLMGDYTLGLLDPRTGAFRQADPALADQLVSDVPRARLLPGSPPPVVQVSSDDPLLAAAVNKARRRWPEFVSAFSRRHPEQHFSVKAPLTHDGRTEHIWIEVSALTADYICGRLGNDPVDLGALKLGDPVTVPVSAMEDWLYVLSNEPVGGFTIPVVTSAPRRARPGD